MSSGLLGCGKVPSRLAPGLELERGLHSWWWGVAGFGVGSKLGSIRGSALGAVLGSRGRGAGFPFGFVLGPAFSLVLGVELGAWGGGAGL